MDGSPVRVIVPGARRISRGWYYALAIALGSAVLVNATPPPTLEAAAGPIDLPAPPPAPATVQTQPPKPAAAPMDEPLRLLAEARQAFAGVRDYSCLFIKRERLNGVLQPEHVMQMKCRNQPFAVHLKWTEPRATAGQEVCYAHGRNQGKLRVRGAGLLGAVGFVSLDLTDPRATQTSRHPISEAGLAHLLEATWQGWQLERTKNLTQVSIGTCQFDGRACVRIDTYRPTNPDKCFEYARTVFYIDRDSKLPVRVECYDWPRRAGDPCELLEEYSYLRLQCNVGLTDDLFAR